MTRRELTIYNLTRSKRKTISLSVNRDLEVVVKAPLKMPAGDIESFVNKHSDWIEKHKLLTEQRIKHESQNTLSNEEKDRLWQSAKAMFPRKVAYYAGIIGVNPAGVRITSATTRWGSCSPKNSLCFSYRLALLPDELIDYIVVHELAHIRIKNHSADFYAEVVKYMPDYKERQGRLRQIQMNLPK